jgi:hypothetical protein
LGTLPGSPSISEATLGRVFFGDERGRSLDPALTVYLLSEYARIFPNQMMGHYLLGRQLATRDPKLAVARLHEACPSVPLRLGGFGELEPVFHKECLRLLGETAYVAGEHGKAGAALSMLERESTPDQPASLKDFYKPWADRLRARDFQERVIWKTKLPPPLPTDAENGTNGPHDRSQVPPR